MRRDKDIIGYMYTDTESKIRESIYKDIMAMLPEKHIKYTAESEDFNPLICWNCQIEMAIEKAAKKALNEIQ